MRQSRSLRSPSLTAYLLGGAAHHSQATVNSPLKPKQPVRRGEHSGPKNINTSGQGPERPATLTSEGFAASVFLFFHCILVTWMATSMVYAQLVS